ncbi:MAG: flagellar export chaperone FliS [Desulfobacterales bacterium]|nr:flagellar export chaperone FliS [Desulfobacterales bacterium]
MAYNSTALNSYQKAQVYDEIDPKKLILMLYEGAIKRIKLSRKGLQENNPRLRGENLGKAIAIISELNASLDTSVESEEIMFLAGLYNAMLVELPKVAVNNDVKTLDRAEKYLMELKRIWETTVMKKSAPVTSAQPARQPNLGTPGGQYPNMAPQQRTSFAV